MAKFLFRANYSQEGVNVLIEEGGLKRREALQQTIEGVGGTLENFYYAFGDTDLFMIADMPDHESAMAISLVINSAGVLDISATEVFEPEFIDGASQKSVTYRVPGD